MRVGLTHLASIHRQLLVRQVVGMRKVHSERGCLGVYATINPVQDRHFQCGLSHTFTPEVPPVPVAVSTTDTVPEMRKLVT